MDILQSIEKLRAQLIEVGLIKGLQDPQVIEISQKLDVLINIYYGLDQANLNEYVAC